MTLANQDLGDEDPFIAGDYKEIVVTVDDGEGSAEDIAGSDITYKILPYPGETPVVEKTVGSGIAITDAAAGEFTVTLEGSDTDGLSGTFHHRAIVTKNTLPTHVFVGTIEVQE